MSKSSIRRTHLIRHLPILTVATQVRQMVGDDAPQAIGAGSNSGLTGAQRESQYAGAEA
jgi:hypothetical protein